MATLTSADVTVASVRRERVGRLNHHYVDFTFGDGALTYPSAGIPLPALSKLGMLRELVLVNIEQPPGNGFHYKFDRANHKLRIYRSAGFTPAGTVAAPTMAVTNGTAGNAVTFNTDHLEATGGGTLACGAPAFTGTAVSAAALVEADTSHAPASTTIRCLLIGQ